jgi:phospholipid N-methyltransferase
LSAFEALLNFDFSMASSLQDYRLFFQQFRRNFETTGAIAPSGRWLAMALSRYVREGAKSRRILEVGPGTGAVTGQIVASLSPTDQFDLVELNDAFVARLRERFEQEPGFVAVADRARVIHDRLETLPQCPTYDLIISGLPLNNFQAEDVRQILASFSRLLKPGDWIFPNLPPAWVHHVRFAGQVVAQPIAAT